MTARGCEVQSDYSFLGNFHASSSRAAAHFDWKLTKERFAAILVLLPMQFLR